MYNISNLKDDIVRAGHGAALNKVKNPLSLFFISASEFLLDCDPTETKRTSLASLYDQTYDYSSPADLKLDKVIDIRPQASRTVDENFTKTGNENLDYNKKDKDFTIEYRSGTKVLRVVKALTGNVSLNTLDGTTANGTWAAVSGGTNLAADTIYKTQGSGSLKFDVGATGGGIENSTMQKVDLSDHENISSLFLWVYFPDASIITNVILRWGSDSGAYFSRTVTAPHFGSFVNGWNLLRFDWNGATETGTADTDNIDYVRIFVTSTAADTEIRVDQLTSRLPWIYELLYYSEYLFRTEAGVWAEKPVNDSDIINLSTTSYAIYFNKVMINVSQQVQGTDAQFDATLFQNKYLEGLKRYKAQVPSEATKSKSYYWDDYFR